LSRALEKFLKLFSHDKMSGGRAAPAKMAVGKDFVYLFPAIAKIYLYSAAPIAINLQYNIVK